MMGIVVSETCWAYKKYNKNNKWHLVGFYSSFITMMHGPTNIKFTPKDAVTHRLVLINTQVWMHILCDHLHITVLLSLYQTLAQNMKELTIIKYV